MAASVARDEAEATSRLVNLLSYVKEVSTLGREGSNPADELVLGGGGSSASKGGGDAAVLLHEAPLRSLEGLSGADGQPVLWLGDGHSRVWMRLRRPDGGSSSQSALHKQACAAYATLFSLRQEALREGHGAQLMVGVGLIRGKIAGKTIDHPLVLLPADLELDTDGALVVSMANAAQASLWPFPGLPSTAPAVVQIDRCARDYGLIGTAQPPSPRDRDKWEPLFERAAHCLSPDGQYFNAAPKKTKGAGYAPHAGPIHVHNTFVLYTRDAASHGDLTVTKDADAMIEALRRLPKSPSGAGGSSQLPAALGRLACVRSVASPLPPPNPQTHTSRAARLAGIVMTCESVAHLFLSRHLQRQRHTRQGHLHAACGASLVDGSAGVRFLLWLAPAVRAQPGLLGGGRCEHAASAAAAAVEPVSVLRPAFQRAAGRGGGHAAAPGLRCAARAAGHGQVADDRERDLPLPGHRPAGAGHVQGRASDGGAAPEAAGG
jgi:hypothetical protein